MDVSIVVPTFNRRELVIRTLKSLFAQDVSPNNFEVVVVVDGSTDGTADALKRLRPECRYRVIEQENRGLAGARNTGYRAAVASLVIFLDDDMICDPGLVRAHVEAHNAVDNIAAFGALFLSEDSPPSLAAECFKREVGAYHLHRKDDPEALWHKRECVFSNTSLARKYLIDIGGFDEEFRMREDLEFGTRLFATGVIPAYIENAVAFQYYDKSSADLIRDAERFAIADVLYEKKHPGGANLGEIRWQENEPSWRRNLRRIAAQSPAIADAFLTPLRWLGESFIGVRALRELGVRALQMQRRIHWHSVVRERMSS
jgi:GT2 family glycosyltransferase